jgi:chromosome segregation ATPase
MPRPYTRGEFNRALLANAALDPFSIVLATIVLVIGILTGLLPILGPAAAVVYLAGAARTYFDEDEANRVLERERAKRRAELQGGRPKVRERDLAPEIAGAVRAARERQHRVAEAIAAAELPYEDVADEVDRLVAAMEATAMRAQLLWTALADTPPERVEARLRQVQGDPEQKELAEALTVQLETLRRMERQLRRFFTEMERLLVELDTVRGQIVSVSAAEGAGQSDQIAGEVRALREQMGAVADGMAAAYEDVSR